MAFETMGDTELRALYDRLVDRRRITIAAIIKIETELAYREAMGNAERRHNKQEDKAA